MEAALSQYELIGGADRQNSHCLLSGQTKACKEDDTGVERVDRTTSTRS